MKTANGLAARLDRSRSGGRPSTELVGLLAGRLHVLDCALDGLAAGDPYELFLAVGSQEADPSFADRIAEMYESWAAARGMQVGHLTSDPGHHVLAVSGLGCWQILHGEAGLHVLEHAADDDGRSAERETARVTVAPRATRPTPEGEAVDEARARARRRSPRRTSSSGATGPARPRSSGTRRAATGRATSIRCSRASSTSTERYRRRKPSPRGSSGSSTNSARPVR